MFKGLDALTRQLDEASKAAAALDGTITTLNFNPADPGSVNAAIRDMERAVEAKVSRYRNNPLVADIVKQTKAHFRDVITQKAREAT
jgi:hypothetical protein